jgi:hypothetical protein
MDNRKSPRRDIILDIELSYPSGDKQIVSTRDISDGGVFLILDQLDRPVLGELVGVKLVGDSIEKEILPGTDAVVVHQEPQGIGLAFIQIELDEDF